MNGLTISSWVADSVTWHKAVKEGNYEVVRQLADACPQLIHDIGPSGCPALSVAVTEGYVKIVAHLLALDPKSVDAVSRGWTALHWATCNGSEQMVAQLLSARPKSIDAPDMHGWTALHWAAREGNEKITAQLLAAGSRSVDALDHFGRTPLYWAAKEGHRGTVAQLLAAGTRLAAASDENGYNALHWAAARGHEHIAEMLLASQPELISTIGPKGNTVLHLALRSQQRREEFVVSLWRRHAAAVHVVNTDRQTPFHLAVQYECAVETMLWGASFDTVVDAFAACKRNCKTRLWPIVEQQCGYLLVVLNRDVIGTVYGYLGFVFPKKPAKNEDG